jgi:hypothetical protein
LKKSDGDKGDAWEFVRAHNLNDNVNMTLPENQYGQLNNMFLVDPNKMEIQGNSGMELTVAKYHTISLLHINEFITQSNLYDFNDNPKFLRVQHRPINFIWENPKGTLISCV